MLTDITHFTTITNRKLQPVAIRRSPTHRIAYDLHNLLTNAQEQSEAALHSVTSDHDARPFIEKAARIAEYALGLTNQLLSQEELAVEPHNVLDLNHLIRESLVLVETTCLDQISLQLNLDARLPAIYGKREQLKRMMLNLILNATQAIQPNSGAITISTGKKFIASQNSLPQNIMGRHFISGETVFLSIADTGSGMDPGTLADAFRPFFTTKPAGEGLGLVDVLEIVNNHHGGILAQSQLSQGTTFTIFFPVYQHGRN